MSLYQLIHPAGSVDIQKEVNGIFVIFRVRMQNETEQLKAYVQNRVNNVTQEFVNFTLSVKAGIRKQVSGPCLMIAEHVHN